MSSEVHPSSRPSAHAPSRRGVNLLPRIIPRQIANFLLGQWLGHRIPHRGRVLIGSLRGPELRRPCGRFRRTHAPSPWVAQSGRMHQEPRAISTTLGISATVTDHAQGHGSSCFPALQPLGYAPTHRRPVAVPRCNPCSTFGRADSKYVLLCGSNHAGSGQDLIAHPVRRMVRHSPSEGNACVPRTSRPRPMDCRRCEEHRRARPEMAPACCLRKPTHG